LRRDYNTIKNIKTLQSRSQKINFKLKITLMYDFYIKKLHYINQKNPFIDKNFVYAAI